MKKFDCVGVYCEAVSMMKVIKLLQVNKYS